MIYRQDDEDSTENEEEEKDISNELEVKLKRKYERKTIRTKNSRQRNLRMNIMNVLYSRRITL